MPSTLAPIAPPAGEAASIAATNFRRNHQALTFKTVLPGPPDVEWLYARDGSLTALDSTGHWISNCSVPRYLAGRLFSRAQAGGAVCLLAPTHAAQIAVVAQQLKPSQAILVILPDLDTYTLALHCEDFSADLAASRLFFAAGDDWESQLHRILTDNPGLPIPGHFVKSLLLAESDASSLMRAVQQVLSQVATSRASQINSLIASSKPSRTGPLCILAPQQFRLWDDLGHTLAQTLLQDDSLNWCLLDTDNPAGLSDLLLAQAASTASAIITPNIARRDLPRVIPHHVPVITWLTTTIIPPHDPKFPHDALILSDPALMPSATRAGWPSKRLRVGALPQFASRNSQFAICNSEPSLSLIADTHLLPDESPAFDLSTHRILWDMIRQELLANPFALGNDLSAYLRSRMARLDIDAPGLEVQRFHDHLLLPAHQQGLARLLLRANLPLQLFGANWDQTPFASRAAGPIASREAFHHALAKTSALIHPFPTHSPLPVNLPIVSATSERDLLQLATRALAGTLPVTISTTPPLTSTQVRQLLGAA